MDTLGYQLSEGIIHKAMTGHPGPASEGGSADVDVEMTACAVAFRMARMTRMAGAVIGHDQFCRRKGRSQRGMDGGGP